MMDRDDPSITAITVAYFSATRIARMYDSLPQGLPLVVVDNSRQPELSRWAAGKRNVRLLVPDSNVGFGAARNRLARESTTDWLLFLNPDTTFTRETTRSVAQFLLAHPDAVAFGPVLQDPDGGRSFKRKSPLARPLGLRSAPATSVRVPFLSGAALFVRRRAFEEIGGFDERIFLFFEDDDLTWRLHRRFGAVFLVPSIPLIHVGGESTEGSVDVDIIKKYHWGKSEAYVLAKHAGPMTLAWVVVAQCLKLLNPCNVFSPRRFILQLYKVAGLCGLKLRLS